jgi:Na+-translocating ferredoxin:NAD+ oxidoreductase RnfC subunit
VAAGLALVAEACGAQAADLLSGPQPFYPAAPPGVLAVPAELLRQVAAASAGQVMLSRLVAVTGPSGSAVVLELPIGTRVERALELAGIEPAAVGATLLGGWLRGRRARAGEAVDKDTAAVLALARPIAPGRLALRRALDACMQCRRCTDLCPPAQLGAPLAPHRALGALVHGGAARVRLSEQAAWCTRCGVCQLACPYQLDPRAAYEDSGVKWSRQVESEVPPPLRLGTGRLQARAPFPALAGRPRVLSGLSEVHEVALPTGGATATIERGSQVRRGAVLVPAQTGLPAVHASIGGTVAALLSDAVLISG